jgi:hypothetical protein
VLVDGSTGQVRIELPDRLPGPARGRGGLAGVTRLRGKVRLRQDSAE